MRAKYHLTLFAIAALLLIALACGESASDSTATPLPTVVPPATATVVPSPTPEPTATPDPLAELFPVTVSDSREQTLTFDAPPERIVAFDSAVVEILFSIGEGHRVIGTHDFVTYPPEADDVPRLGSAFEMNIEQIVALKPDLVFIFSDGFLEDLERANLNVFYQKSLSNDFRKVAENIRLWGNITGAVDRADEVAEEFTARVAALEKTLEAVDEGPVVFQDEGGLWTPGPDTLIGEVFTLLKLRNLAHDISGYVQMSPEVIVERDPDLVIVFDNDNFSTNDAFKDVTAVKENRVLLPSSNALRIAGPRFVAGMEEIAKWVYPDLFE